jgi:hypothetical protein
MLLPSDIILILSLAFEKDKGHNWQENKILVVTCKKKTDLTTILAEQKNWLMMLLVGNCNNYAAIWYYFYFGGNINFRSHLPERIWSDNISGWKEKLTDDVTHI